MQATKRNKRKRTWKDNLGLTIIALRYIVFAAIVSAGIICAGVGLSEI